MLTWLHFGDLHATDEDGGESLDRFKVLVEDANRNLSRGVDFAFLPGDNANHGTPEQYRDIRDRVRALSLPLHIIPGDHDFEPGTLDNFHAGLNARTLPYAVEHDERRCLFLNVVSSGAGGPDFRLGEKQRLWLEDQLKRSDGDRRRAVVFMHAFPGDLRDDPDGIGRLFADHRVAFVDTGHTHYNELLNDGAVVYSATRSTGQLEEGAMGFSIATVDGSSVSWRFKPYDQAWPFVLITSPADRRLVAPLGDLDLPMSGAVALRAKVWGEAVSAVIAQVDGGAKVPMAKAAGDEALWTLDIVPLPPGRHALRVEARSRDGVIDADEIEFDPVPAARAATIQSPGDHRHAIGAWPARGVLGTRLGPNAKGRHW